MLSLSSGFNYYLCSEPVTLRYRHAGLRNYIKSQLQPMATSISFFQRTAIVSVSIIFIIKEKFLRKRYFVPTIS